MRSVFAAWYFVRSKHSMSKCRARTESSIVLDMRIPGVAHVLAEDPSSGRQGAFSITTVAMLVAPTRPLGGQWRLRRWTDIDDCIGRTVPLPAPS